MRFDGLLRWRLGFVAGCGSSKAPDFPQEADAHSACGFDWRSAVSGYTFLGIFCAHMTGVNNPLPVGDPVVQTVPNRGGAPLPGPFAGQSINCRSCHFVTEFQGVAGAGNRTYADFTTRSPIPLPMENFDHTPRNSMQMVGSLQPRSGPTLLHFDGEFATPEDLVEQTMTGRNFGWSATQFQQALAHIARVVREDDGNGQLAADRLDGLPLAVIFKGTDPRITPDLLLPPSQRIDVTTATDQQILDEIALCISTYMGDLLFKQDEFGRYIASPYDVFLRINHLPVQPRVGQTPAAYAQVLLQAINSLGSPVWVDQSYGTFAYHNQKFQFGSQELAGLKIFLSSATNATMGRSMRAIAWRAMCRRTLRILYFTTRAWRRKSMTRAWCRRVHDVEYSVAHGAESELRSLSSGDGEPSECKRGLSPCGGGGDGCVSRISGCGIFISIRTSRIRRRL